MTCFWKPSPRMFRCFGCRRFRSLGPGKRVWGIWPYELSPILYREGSANLFGAAASIFGVLFDYLFSRAHDWTAVETAVRNSVRGRYSGPLGDGLLPQQSSISRRPGNSGWPTGCTGSRNRGR